MTNTPVSAELLDFAPGGFKRRSRSPQTCQWLHAKGGVLQVSSEPTSLDSSAALLEAMKADAAAQNLVLLESADDPERNLAVVVLKGKLERGFEFLGRFGFLHNGSLLKWELRAAESGTTGVRESTVSVLEEQKGNIHREGDVMVGWESSETPGLFLSDLRSWDEYFPQHPLSFLRREMGRMQQTFMVRDAESTYQTHDACLAATQLALEGIKAVQSGQREEAVRCYQRAIETYPKSTTALTLLGCHYADHGEAGKGLEILDRAVKAGADDGSLWMSVGVCFTGVGQAEQALPYLEKACRQVDPSFAAFAHRNKSEALLACGRAEEALESLQRAETLSETAPSLFLRGQIMSKLGKKAEAKASFEQLLQLMPEEERIKKAIAELD